MQQQNSSEVARLVAQITAEYEAAQNAIYGMASGTARHSFITARMERMNALRCELVNEIGDREAMAAMWEALEKP